MVARTMVIHWKSDREAAAITGPETARNMLTEAIVPDAINDGKSRSSSDFI